MKNLDWCIYTYKHRKMFAYMAEKLIKNPEHKKAILERAKWHDVDKLLMYMFLDQTVSQLHHVEIRKHHLEYKPLNEDDKKDYLDYLETVIDYECSPYTKPDKPLNSFDFLNKLLDMRLVERSEADILFSIMEELGIASSYSVLDDEEGMKYASSLDGITEEDILLEVLTYLKEGQDDVLSWIIENSKNKNINDIM